MPDMRSCCYDGTPDERRHFQRTVLDMGTFNVLLTHYDLVMRDKAVLRKVWPSARVCNVRSPSINTAVLCNVMPLPVLQCSAVGRGGIHVLEIFLCCWLCWRDGVAGQ